MPRTHTSTKEHEWTAFEKHTLLCLLCRNIHVTGIVKPADEDAVSVKGFRKSHRGKPSRSSGGSEVSKRSAHMDVATLLNRAINGGASYEQDIPLKEVSAMIDHLIEVRPRVMGLLERYQVGRVTRFMRLMWEREEGGRMRRLGQTVNGPGSGNQQVSIWAADTAAAAAGNSQSDGGWGTEPKSISSDSIWGVGSTATLVPTALNDIWGNETTQSAPSAVIDDAWGGGSSHILPSGAESDAWGGGTTKKAPSAPTEIWGGEMTSDTRVSPVDESWSKASGTETMTATFEDDWGGTDITEGAGNPASNRWNCTAPLEVQKASVSGPCGGITISATARSDESTSHIRTHSQRQNQNSNWGGFVDDDLSDPSVTMTQMDWEPTQSPTTSSKDSIGVKIWGTSSITTPPQSLWETRAGGEEESTDQGMTNRHYSHGMITTANKQGTSTERVSSTSPPIHQDTHTLEAFINPARLMMLANLNNSSPHYGEGDEKGAGSPSKTAEPWGASGFGKGSNREKLPFNRFERMHGRGSNTDEVDEIMQDEANRNSDGDGTICEVHMEG